MLITAFWRFRTEGNLVTRPGPYARTSAWWGLNLKPSILDIWQSSEHDSADSVISKPHLLLFVHLMIHRQSWHASTIRKKLSSHCFLFLIPGCQLYWLYNDHDALWYRHFCESCFFQLLKQGWLTITKTFSPQGSNFILRLLSNRGTWLNVPSKYPAELIVLQRTEPTHCPFQNWVPFRWPCIRQKTTGLK